MLFLCLCDGAWVQQGCMMDPAYQRGPRALDCLILAMLSANKATIVHIQFDLFI